MIRAIAQSHPPRSGRGIPALLVGMLLMFARRRRDRIRLARLDPHLLRDIGLDPRAAAEECAKPFWRP